MGGWLKLGGLAAGLASFTGLLPAWTLLGAGVVAWSAGQLLVDRGIQAGQEYRTRYGLFERLEWAQQNVPDSQPAPIAPGLPEELRQRLAADEAWLDPARVSKSEVESRWKSDWVAAQDAGTLEALMDRARDYQQQTWWLREAACIGGWLGVGGAIVSLAHLELVGFAAGVGVKLVCDQLEKLARRRPEPAQRLRELYSELALEDSLKRRKDAEGARSEAEVVQLSLAAKQGVRETDSSVLLGGVSVKKRENVTDASRG
jgi:hypothetical protein